MSTIRVGIAGIGAIASEYLHLYAQGMLHCTVTALQSRSMEKMQTIAQECALGQIAFFTDYEAMLDSGTVDAVIICTPHGMHAVMAVQAIERGLHILIEKPIGTNVGETLSILEQLNRHREVCCGVLYCRRMHPLYRQVKQMVESGAVGTLKRANWIITNLYRTEAYHQSADWRGSWTGECGGVLMTQASHQLDLFLWLCGLPQAVQGFCYTRERCISVENDAALQLEYASGATGQFIASSHEFPGSNRLELSGDKGQIIVEDDKRLLYRQLAQSESSYAVTSPNIGGPIPFTETVAVFEDCDNRTQQAAILNDFFEKAAQGGEPVCTAKSAMDSLAVINAAYLSAWKNERIPMLFDEREYFLELQKRQF